MAAIFLGDLFYALLDTGKHDFVVGVIGFGVLDGLCAALYADDFELF